jgi:hypothetical protein
MTSMYQVTTTLPDSVDVSAIPPLGGYTVEIQAIAPPGPAGGGGVSYSTTQGLTTAQQDQALRNIAAARTIEPEQFNTGTDQGNLQACLNYGASVDSLTFVQMRSKTYTVGTAGSSATALTWDGTHGTVYFDGRGATLTYLGTGTMWSSSCHVGGNTPPFIHYSGGTWIGTTAAFGHYGLDIRSCYFGDIRVQFDAGAAFCQANQDSFCERNTYERIDDKTSKHLLVMDRVPFKSVPTGGTVTFADSGDLVTFTVPHTLRVGERVKFIGTSGSFGVTAGTTYYAETVPTNSTLTLSSTADGLTHVPITANGTATQGWTEPAGSMARTVLREAKIQGGTATFCKIQVTNGASPYDSHFSVRGNVPDGVGVYEILGANSLGDTDFDARCEPVSNLAGGAFLLRWGQAGGFPPTLSPNIDVDRLNVLDPLAAAPDTTSLIFGQHKFHGFESQTFRANSFCDFYGRTTRATLGAPINPSVWITNGGGGGGPEGGFGNMILTGASTKHIYTDVSGGTGTAVWQQLDTLLNTTLTSSTFVRTSNYTAVAGEVVRAKPASASTITLPTAPQDGTRIIVRNLSSAGVVTVAAGGSDVFRETGGVTTLSLSNPNSGVYVQYMATGAIWVVLFLDQGTVTTAAAVGSVVGEAYYDRTAANSVDATTTSTTGVDMTASMIAAGTPWVIQSGATVSANTLDATFTAPASGKVMVYIEALVKVSAAGTQLRFGLYDVGASAQIANTQRAVLTGTNFVRAVYSGLITGLTSGTSYTYRPQWLVAGAVTGTMSGGGANGPVRMTIEAR